MVSDSKSLSGHKRSHSRNRCGKGKQKSNRASDAELCRHRSGSSRRECGVRRRSHPARIPFDVSPRREAGDLRHRHRSGASQEFVHPAHFHFLPAMIFFRCREMRMRCICWIRLRPAVGGEISSGFDCPALQWVVRQDHLQAGLERDMQERCSR